MTRTEVLNGLLFPKDGKHLGDLCGWSLSGTIPQKDAQDIATRLGLHDDFQFPRLSPASAYRRAVIMAVKSGKRDEESYEAVKVEDNDDRVVHSIISKDIVDKMNGSLSDRDAEFYTETQIGFDKNNYQITSDRPHFLCERIKANYSSLLEAYKPEDIRIAFQRAFDRWSGINLLDHGGLWWIPSPSASKLRAWKEFMRITNNTSLVIPVFDTSETIDGLRQITSQSIEGQITEIMDELKEFATKGESIRTSTLENRVERFDTIRDKAELYERLLGHRLDELKNKVREAQRGLMDTISILGAQ